MISFPLIQLVVDVVILGLVYWAVSLIPLPAPFNQIVKVIFVIIAVLILLSALGFSTGFPQIR